MVFYHTTHSSRVFVGPVQNSNKSAIYMDNILQGDVYFIQRDVCASESGRRYCRQMRAISPTKFRSRLLLLDSVIMLSPGAFVSMSRVRRSNRPVHLSLRDLGLNSTV